MTRITYGSVWYALYDDPRVAKQMELWSLREMGKEQLIKECDLYFESVYQNVDTADTEGIITKTLEMLYGEGIWSTLNALADAKSEGRSYRRPNILECHERKVYDVNPEGTPPARSCKWCKTDKQDWRGIDTSYLEMTCDFCKDRGQDW